MRLQIGHTYRMENIDATGICLARVTDYTDRTKFLNLFRVRVDAKDHPKNGREAIYAPDGRYAGRLADEMPNLVEEVEFDVVEDEL